MTNEPQHDLATTQPSRRRFLQTASTAGVAALGALSPARSAHAAGKEEIKLALVGCGGRGTGAAAQALSTNAPVKLWAMADVFQDRIDGSLQGLLKGQEARYDRVAHGGYTGKIDVPPERRFAGFDAFRQAIDSGVDWVILATSPHFRPQQYEYAVRQGKHVFMEKPLAVDAPGIRQVLAAGEEAKRKGLKVGTGFQRRHQKSYQETVERIHSGVLGDIKLLRVFWNGGYLWAVPRTDAMSEMEFQMRNWNYFTWLSGDHIVEQHVHNLDVAYWVLGKTPVEAQGMGGRQVRTDPLYGHIFDHHAVEFTYDDGVKVISQCRQMQGTWMHVAEHVHGTEGTSQVDRGVVEAAGERWRFRGQGGNPYQVSHDVLVDAILNDKPHMEADASAYATMMGIMGRMATYSGQVVRWDEALGSELKLAPQSYALDADPPILPDETGRYPVAMPGVTKAW